MNTLEIASSLKGNPWRLIQESVSTRVGELRVNCQPAFELNLSFQKCFPFKQNFKKSYIPTCR